jgi:hypothetical protein
MSGIVVQSPSMERLIMTAMSEQEKRDAAEWERAQLWDCLGKLITTVAIIFLIGWICSLPGGSFADRDGSYAADRW